MIAPEPSIEPAFGERVEVVGHVEVRGGQHRRGGAAGEPALDRAPLRRAAGEAVDDLARGDARARSRSCPGAARGRRPTRAWCRSRSPRRASRTRSPPIRMIAGTVASVSTLLISVGSLVEALVGREGRLQARVAALALERVEQARLLAADVGAGAAVHDEREGVLGAEDVLADVARLARFVERRLEHVGLQHVLAADVDERAARAGRVGGDDDPLEQHVRASSASVRGP